MQPGLHRFRVEDLISHGRSLLRAIRSTIDKGVRKHSGGSAEKGGKEPYLRPNSGGGGSSEGCSR